jgi:undecaprenyl-diphosphatase
MPPDRQPLPLRHAIALGLAQGPTELMPISSSAHTILIPWLAGWPYAELDPELRKCFEVALHAGTAAAVLADLRSVDFRQALVTTPRNFDARQAMLIVLSFIPPAVAGYTFEQLLQSRLSGPPTIAAGLLLGGVAMALADAGPQEGTRTLVQASAADGLLLGLAQAFALIPGVSRSGAVLTAARARGFSRADSHTHARRTGHPVILGAGALKTGRLLQRGGVGGAPIFVDRRSASALACGGAAAFLSTLAVTRLLRRHGRAAHAAPLLPYSLYRGLLASLVILRRPYAPPAPGAQ